MELAEKNDYLSGMRIEEAIVFKHPEVFCFNEGRVRLLM